MNKMIVSLVVAFTAAHIFADDSAFINAYDLGNYAEAAKQLEKADLKNPDVLRRAGAMYYNGLSVDADQERGKAYLETAMASHDAKAAVNLAKIYFRNENNSAKASWCLLVAENSGDNSVKTDVANLRERFGDEYKKGLELYVQQMMANMKNTLDSFKKQSAEYDSERRVLRQQISEANIIKADLEAQLQASADELKKLEAKIVEVKQDCGSDLTIANQAKEEWQKKVECLSATVAELQENLKDEKLKYAQKSTDLDAALFELAAATNQIAILTSLPSTIKQQYQEIFDKYNKFVNEKYNPLVRKYNELLTSDKELMARYAKLEADYNALRDREDKEGSFFGCWNGMARGLGTVIMSPLNYVRGFSYVPNVASEWENTGADPFTSKIFSIPMIVFETVPVVVDVFDGVLDFVSFGYYGDWLYGDDKNSPWWFDRSDKGFPWINKK